MIAMPEFPGRQSLEPSVVLSIRRRKDDRRRTSKGEYDSLEGSEPGGIEVFHDLDNRGRIETR
jgi:hypothetical protein